MLRLTGYVRIALKTEMSEGVAERVEGVRRVANGDFGGVAWSRKVSMMS
jgi:hypothetical protein